MSAIFELGFVVGLAAVLALIGRMVRQPPIIAYLLAGVLAGPMFFGVVTGSGTIETFAHVGVAFLLFIVGLSLDFRIFKEVGKVAVVAGVGEMILVSLVGFALASAMGFGVVSAIYIAVAISFSSAVLVVKVLSDKREMETLHGRIALGILLVENFVAAILLVSLPLIGSDSSVLFSEIGKGLLMIVAGLLFSYLIVPAIVSFAAFNQEVLFIFSTAYALISGAVFSYFGLPMEIGALVAGVGLAHSKYSVDISNKIKSTRDFFVVLFFVYLGSQLVGPISKEIIMQAVVLSAFISFGKPIAIMGFMKFFGFKKRTNFFAGLSLAQISELSLVLILLGLSAGAFGNEVLSLVLLVAIITIAINSYSTHYAHGLFDYLSGLLGVFDGGKKDSKKKVGDYEVVLFGYNRIGYSLVKAFESMNKKFLVVDYNPRTILELSERKIDCIYGDASDDEIFESLGLEKTKLVVSTIPDLSVNLAILKRLRRTNVSFIPTAHSIVEAEQLYKNGADYVIMPHFLGGNYVAKMLFDTNIDKNQLAEKGMKHKRELHERTHMGHSHPSRDWHGK